LLHAKEILVIEIAHSRSPDQKKPPCPLNGKEVTDSFKDDSAIVFG
jgi:hypothetical protein